MGRGVTISKVSFLQARDKHVLQLKEENSEFRNRIQQLETVIHKLVGNHQRMQNEEYEDEQNGPEIDKTSPKDGTVIRGQNEISHPTDGHLTVISKGNETSYLESTSCMLTLKVNRFHPDHKEKLWIRKSNLTIQIKVLTLFAIIKASFSCRN
ncbi:uncharacterized protein LOC109846908 [Asparagus officinalis]|uniref:uncharacterized protein LOC109846908 n=1 Tax=Asparagus officinalis TaxID=4686 RepID=UPI00098E4313|nr:uncharacterized protein LOC109846908 [Asparagus officinalis]